MLVVRDPPVSIRNTFRALPNPVAVQKTPWNKGKLVGQKPPLRFKEIWAIRIRLQLAKRARELALFNLALDSKLRGCDLVSLRVGDVAQGNRVSARTMVLQRKTQRPVQFELTEQTREAVAAWIAKAQLRSGDYLFPSRTRRSPHISTRQYARNVGQWVSSYPFLADVRRESSSVARGSSGPSVLSPSRSVETPSSLAGSRYPSTS